MRDVLPSLPWWDAQDTPATLWAAIDAAREKLDGHPALHLFRRQSLLSTVLMANKLEGVLTAGYNQPATYQLLEAELDRAHDNEPQGEPAQRWPAEGNNSGCSPCTRQQLLQSVKAAKYLCSPLKTPLTVDVICTTHKLLMWGAEECDGVLMPAGQLRTAAAHSGTGYTYPAADTIPTRLQGIVDYFNAAVSSSDADPTHLAAEMLYRFVTLHPFTNGNGRMCRLLAAYAACAVGVPFTLHLCNGHGKARQHYLQALRHADNHGRDTSRLQSYVLECLAGQWQNAVAYAGLE